MPAAPTDCIEVQPTRSGARWYIAYADDSRTLTFGLRTDTGRASTAFAALLLLVDATDGAMLRRAAGLRLDRVPTLPMLVMDAASEKSSPVSSADPNRAFHLEKGQITAIFVQTL